MSARHQHGLAATIIIAAFIFFAWRSWRTWPDILVDFGHELYIPWRLAEGEVLYRDIPFTMGPLSQYFNALLFRMFAVSLTTLIAANLLILVAVTAMLFWLFRRCGTLWSATFVTLFFLAVFAFAQYSLIGNYNYVCPYRHEITHGLALGLAELVCLVQFAETRRPAWLHAAGLCIGLIGLTKLEMLLPAVSAALAAVVFARAPRMDAASLSSEKLPLLSPRVDPIDFRGMAAAAARIGLTAMAPIAMAIVALAVSLGWNEAISAVFANWRLSLDPALTRNSAFYRAVSGIDQVEQNVMAMLHIALYIVVGCGIAFVVDRTLGRWIRSWVSAVVTGFLSGVTALVCFDFYRDGFFFSAPLPLILPMVVAACAFESWRKHSAGHLTLCLIAVFGLALLPKILLRVSWGHYGFALAMPGTLVLIHLLVQSIPGWLQRTRNLGAGFRATWAGILTACALVQFLGWDRGDRYKTQAVGSGGNLFYADPRNDKRVVPTVNALTYLRHEMRPDDTLCVIPEGATINYLLRKRNPTGLLIFNPWEFRLHGGESNIADRLAQNTPSHILFVTTDMTEFGAGNFGEKDNGAAILSFISERYETVQVFRRPDAFGGPPFQAVVYRKQRPTD